jgi:hypothetical protein
VLESTGQNTGQGIGKMSAWQVGDIIESRTSPGVFREILAVRETGYSWRYPDLPDVSSVFLSENSNDPSLYHWKRAAQGWASSAPVIPPIDR